LGNLTQPKHIRFKSVYYMILECMKPNISRRACKASIFENLSILSGEKHLFMLYSSLITFLLKQSTFRGVTNAYKDDMIRMRE
jgi:hypothetical protein